MAPEPPQFVGALQSHDQAYKKRDERNDGNGFHTHGHRLVKSALRAQTLATKRTNEGDVSRLAGQPRPGLRRTPGPSVFRARRDPAAP